MRTSSKREIWLLVTWSVALTGWLWFKSNRPPIPPEDALAEAKTARARVYTKMAENDDQSINQSIHDFRANPDRLTPAARHDLQALVTSGHTLVDQTASGAAAADAATVFRLTVTLRTADSFLAAHPSP